MRDPGGHDDRVTGREGKGLFVDDDLGGASKGAEWVLSL
jgi:hypothetical protein